MVPEEWLIAGDATNVRAGVPKSLSRYALVETLRRAEFAEVDAASFKEISASVAKQFEADQGGPLTDPKTQQDEINHKIRAAGGTAEVALDKPAPLGAFFSKPDAYCFGMIALMSGGGSRYKTVSGVTFLRVHNRLLYAYVLCPLYR